MVFTPNYVLYSNNGENYVNQATKLIEQGRNIFLLFPVVALSSILLDN